MKGARSTRERVLGAALANFASRGYGATSLDALADTLGVRKQTILYYFPSKEALLAAVIERAAGELSAALEAGVARASDDRARAGAVVDAVLRLGARRPELLALVREVVRLGPPTSTRLLDALLPLAGRAGVTIPEATVLTVAAMVVGLATEVEVLRAVDLEPDLAWLRRRRRTLLGELGGSGGALRRGQPDGRG
jgi:AcrR family transcriptional regulator